MTNQTLTRSNQTPCQKTVGGLGFWGSWVWRKRKKGVKLMKYDF